MSVEIRIRPMGGADVEATMALAAATPEAPHWDAKAYEGAVARARDQRGVALVAEYGDAGLAGFIVGGLIPPEAEMESIAVAAERQRQGVARKLLNAFASEARLLGCTVILLEVRVSNEAARRFYGASGFAETGRRPAYYANPVEDAILMARPLQ